MKRRWIVIGVLIVVLLAGAAYFGAGYFVFNQLAKAGVNCEKHMANYPDQFVNDGDWPDYQESDYYMATYETVRFPSRNPDLQIAGWYVPGDPDKPAVIVVDGIGGCKHAQAALVPAGMLAHQGFNVLMIDLHETGKSDVDDGYSTIGNREYLDILGAWDWLIAEKGFTPEQIGIAANSLGAVTTLYAFAAEPQIAAIFLNSPFANLQEILYEELHRAGFPSFLATPALIVGRLVTGQDLLARSPLEAINEAGDRPIYIVHGADDKRINIDHSYQLEAAAKAAGVNATFWFIEGADHVRGPAVYPEEYEQRMDTFFAEVLQ